MEKLKQKLDELGVIPEIQTQLDDQNLIILYVVLCFLESQFDASHKVKLELGQLITNHSQTLSTQMGQQHTQLLEAIFLEDRKP